MPIFQDEPLVDVRAKDGRVLRLPLSVAVAFSQHMDDPLGQKRQQPVKTPWVAPSEDIPIPRDRWYVAPSQDIPIPRDRWYVAPSQDIPIPPLKGRADPARDVQAGPKRPGITDVIPIPKYTAWSTDDSNSNSPPYKLIVPKPRPSKGSKP